MVKARALLGAMSGACGRIAAMEVRGATDENVMESFVTQVLSKQVAPGDCVVMDNLSAHKTKKVRAAFAALKVTVFYLPPYSPDFNPIEMCWSKLKTLLRTTAARSYESLSEAITAALKKITVGDISNWVKHCGYV